MLAVRYQLCELVLAAISARVSLRRLLPPGVHSSTHVDCLGEYEWTVPSVTRREQLSYLLTLCWDDCIGPELIKVNILHLISERSKLVKLARFRIRADHMDDVINVTLNSFCGLLFNHLRRCAQVLELYQSLRLYNCQLDGNFPSSPGCSGRVIT